MDCELSKTEKVFNLTGKVFQFKLVGLSTCIANSAEPFTSRVILVPTTWSFLSCNLQYSMDVASKRKRKSLAGVS